MNQTKPVLNPYTGQMESIPAIDRGIEIRNSIYFNIVVKADFTRLQPNAVILDGIEVTIEDGGEMIVL